MDKEFLFSVTKKDCDFKYYRGSGGGGQKKNKTDNCCQCTHKASGAQASSEEGRSKDFNTKNAFKKMTQTKEFKNWINIEGKRRTGELAIIEQKVERELKTNVRVEGKDENGKWVKLDER
jgi:protein subunit release factor B